MNRVSLVAVVLVSTGVVMLTSVVLLAVLCRRGTLNYGNSAVWPCRFIANDQRATRTILAVLAVSALLMSAGIAVMALGSAQ